MLFVKAQLTIAPDQRARFLEAMETFTQVSRAEAGCLGFACYEDVNMPSAFIVLEEWQDQTSFERHESSSHLADFKTQIAGAIISREATRVFTIDSVGGLPPKAQA